MKKSFKDFLKNNSTNPHFHKKIRKAGGVPKSELK